ncbi:hypothetical protein KQI89_12970 [Clostridium sp. MSJ-4]|uniref:Uncharacterized protein n=1 Tax=Clostridium simiarum TaxID=2841506 RepID=A0ABS6F2B7_9CLOT|nr:hypothetical protein [Clostridium simiarum]MBU5592667.1 hypothetical protein [Clostridium simiarum]
MEIATNLFLYNFLCKNLNNLDSWSKISKTAIIDKNLCIYKFCANEEIPVLLTLTEDECYHIDDYLYDRMISEFDSNGEPNEIGSIYESLYDLWHSMIRIEKEKFYEEFI